MSSSPDAAPLLARAAMAVATCAAVWCLLAAHLLSPLAGTLVLALLLVAEAVATIWPAYARKVVLPVALLLFAAIAVGRITTASATTVDSARPLGAFLTAGAMVVLALAGGKRRDVLARLGLLAAATGLALTADARAAAVPAVAVALAGGAALVVLERALLASAPTVAQSLRPPPPLARTRLIAVPLAGTAALTAVIAGNVTLPKHQPRTTIGAPAGLDGSSGNSTSAETRLDPASTVMDLRLRGPLSNRAVARIRPIDDDSSSHLWRAQVMAGYDGTNWYVDSDASPVAASGYELVDEVIPVGSQDLPLLTPGTASRLVTPDSTDDDPLFPQTLSGAYQVTSVVPAGAAAQIEATPKAVLYPGESVPSPVVPARVLALGRRLTEQATTRQQAVDAVVAYLRSHETYQLDSPVPAKGTDAVDDFLFRSHRGFCEQFASAAAILLQASGVPTRVVTGYASGLSESDGSWLLRGSDAHAWIEVEYPSVGWLPVDPTAGARLAPARSGWDWRPLALGGSALLLAGLVAAGVAAVRRRRALRADPLRHSLLMLDAALGSARRNPNESLRDLTARLPLTPAESLALGIAERAFYGASPPDAAEISTAAATMRRTARRLRRERLIPRRRRVRH